MKNNQIKKGIMLILLSAIMTCSGQTFWKLGADSATMILFYGIGFVCYGLGALLMILSFRFGEMSVLQPMLSVGFIAALFVGYFLFKENIDAKKIIGVVLILLGIVILSFSKKSEPNDE